jgi:uncharacterized membrane protein YedE/YeeE
MNTSSLRHHFIMGLFGLLMGVGLTFIGFADFGELHRMLVFTDLRLLFTFAGAVIISFAGFAVLARGKKLQRKILHQGTIPGGVLFGLGWAITGACPSVALVQFGEGYLPALATMTGIALGVRSYRWMHARYFHWDTGACEV